MPLLNLLDPGRLQRRSLNEGQEIPNQLLVSASGKLVTQWEGRTLGVYQLQPNKTGENKTEPVWKGVEFYLFRITDGADTGKWAVGPHLGSTSDLRLISSVSGNSPLDSSLMWQYYLPDDGWNGADDFSISEHAGAGEVL